MTMVEDSDSEDERLNPAADPKPSTSKSPVSKPKISPKEETPVVKQEPDASPQPARSSDTPAYPGRPPGSSVVGTSSYGLPFPSLVQASQQQAIAGGGRDTLSAVTSLQGGTSWECKELSSPLSLNLSTCTALFSAPCFTPLTCTAP